MRIATPGPARSHLLLLATLVLVLGGGSLWLALGTARPLEAPPLPSANTALPSATPASARSPTATITAAVGPTATATPAPHAGRAILSRNLVGAGHNNRPANMVGYLQKHNQVRMETQFGHPAWLCLISTHPATAHGEAPHVHAI
jgi:hypothetical protein